MSYGVPGNAKLHMLGRMWERGAISWFSPGKVSVGRPALHFEGDNVPMMDLIWCHKNQDRIAMERMATALGVSVLDHPEYDVGLWLDLVFSVLFDLRKAQAVDESEPGVVDGSAVVTSGEPSDLNS